ncbi:MAG: hypothetical protein K6F49_04060 [Saccharofermentans sp.]|nr:hypothetical protein [Saccharofermentans sp.]
MATLTRLASTLTARYFPSQTLTDAFYIDGRLFGKREARQADITIDKEERGFFFSVFAHPTIPEYEIGTLPPYEPQLRGTCNEVKFGRKEIDGMIEGFLATAVDVTGKMKLNDNNDRAPYFAGVIVRDSEAFAVTIGTGLAFLYRDDTLFPLTDAGIPMEPIDSMGNRVGDFMYYCSSKTANALWSNFFTLSPDDCIILCNKEIYDALGQREILRILAEAEDQCDAAGVIITQASARMPNVPMQFSISFVESVTNEDKKGLFGFRKKNKEEDMSSMSIESTTEGGVVGAASAAIADAGFTSGLTAAASAEAGVSGAAASAAIMFGDKIPSPVAPSENQVASADKGIELTKDQPAASAAPIEFLDTSVSSEPAVEVSAEEVMKNLFEDSLKKEEKKEEEIIEESPFVAGGFNPFDEGSEASDSASPEMETVSSTPVILPDDDNAETKPIDNLNLDILKTLEKTGNNSTIKSEDIIQAALKELNEGNEVVPQVEDDKKPVSNSDEIVFSQGNEAITFDSNETEAKASAEFDPYGVGDGSEMQNAVPLVFGDDGSAKAPTEEELKSDGKDGIPVPDFEIETAKPELKEDDKLSLDFPEVSKAEEEKKEDKKVESEEKKEAPSSGFELPFENPVETFSDEPQAAEESSDIPDMPVFDGNTFDTPVNAVSSEEPINTQTEDVYSYGQYVENENMAAAEPEFTTPAPEYAAPEQPAAEPPYQSFGNEGNGYSQYDNGYQYQPGQYQSYDDNAGAAYAGQAAQPEQQQTSSADNDWINAILGIDDEEDYASAQAAAYDQSVAPAATTATTAATTAAAASAPSQRRPGGAPGPRPQGGRPGAGPAKKPVSPASGMGGGRGPGGGKRFPKLNRNGYMFLAFVAVCLIIFIILISAIVRSCGKKEGGDETEETTTTTVEETTTALPVETTAAPAGPNDPMGVFVFSDHVGYRSWWDLFHTAYGIDIENESDERIDRVLAYNGMTRDTFPSPIRPETLLVLPPVEMLDPNVELVPYVTSETPADTEAPAETASDETEAPEEN